MPFKIISFLIGATVKGKNMLPKGSISFTLMLAPLRCGFLDVETYSTVQKLAYRNRYEHTKNVCPSIGY